MKLLPEILDYLKVEKEMVSIFKGEIEVPFIFDHEYHSFNEDWYPHPPVILPIFINYESPHMRGLLIHHFVKRQRPWVTFYLESESLVETARTTEQFFTEMVVDALEVYEEVTDDLRTFCQKVNYTQLDAVARATENQYYGNYEIIPTYDKSIPLDYSSGLEQYDGDFPSTYAKPHMPEIINVGALSNACGAEITDLQLVQEIASAPDWLKFKEDRRALFQIYLTTNQLGKAWLTLNSGDFKLGEIATGLRQLKELTTDELFHLTADNWLAGFETSEGYDDFAFSW